MRECWICGSAANSSEHRLKKSDLVRAYGRGPYKGDSRPLHISNGKQSEVQGPNSRVVKYDSILCDKCNTTKTQPYDFAYEQLIKWLFQNEDKILRQREIDFMDVYGSDFELKQLDLFKYFAKSIGCRIADAGESVPIDLRAIFKNESPQTKLQITFSVNEDILSMPQNHRDGFIGKGDLMAMKKRTDPSQITGFYFNEHVSWFTIYYWHGMTPEEGAGSVWVANSRKVALGSHYANLTPDQREEFLKCLK